MSSLRAQLVKNPPVIQETLVWFLGWEDCLEMGEATYSSILGLPCGSADESARRAGDLGLIPGLGRSLQKEKASHPSVPAWSIPRTV